LEVDWNNDSFSLFSLEVRIRLKEGDGSAEIEEASEEDVRLMVLGGDVFGFDFPKPGVENEARGEIFLPTWESEHGKGRR
jgi:hypothetical protein